MKKWNKIGVHKKKKNKIEVVKSKGHFRTLGGGVVAGCEKRWRGWGKWD